MPVTQQEQSKSGNTSSVDMGATKDFKYSNESNLFEGSEKTVPMKQGADLDRTHGEVSELTEPNATHQLNRTH